MDKLKMDLSRLAPKHSSDIKPDLCRCESCRQAFKITDCIPDTDHHDGWELPQYTIDRCPSCEDGVMTDYSFSRPLRLKWEAMVLKEKRNEEKHANSRPSQIAPSLPAV